MASSEIYTRIATNINDSLYGGLTANDIRTSEDLEKLKKGIRPNYNRGGGTHNSTIRQAELQVEEARLRLNAFNNLRQSGYESNRRDKSAGGRGRFDDNAFTNSPEYRVASRNYAATKDRLNMLKRTAEQESAGYKLLAATMEQNGQAKRIRDSEKYAIKKNIYDNVNKAKLNTERNDSDKARIEALGKHLKDAKSLGAISSIQNDIAQRRKNIAERESETKSIKTSINKLLGDIDRIDGTSLIKKADNNARARKANKRAPKLTRKRRK
jgi:hypothetical protein